MTKQGHRFWVRARIEAEGKKKKKERKGWAMSRVASVGSGKDRL